MAVRSRVTAPKRWGTWMPDAVAARRLARRLREGGRMAAFARRWRGRVLASGTLCGAFVGLAGARVRVVPGISVFSVFIAFIGTLTSAFSRTSLRALFSLLFRSGCVLYLCAAIPNLAYAAGAAANAPGQAGRPA